MEIVVERYVLNFVVFHRLEQNDMKMSQHRILHLFVCIGDLFSVLRPAKGLQNFWCTATHAMTISIIVKFVR